jgi:hypothetical protein
VKHSRQVSILWPMLVLSLLTTPSTFAAWDLTKPGDPNRNWGVSETLSGTYDDNWFSTERNRQAGERLFSDLKFRASVPWERLLVATTYDYELYYPRDLDVGGVAQTHNLNVSANYTAGPRLSLSLNNRFINSLEPQLVTGPSGAPVTIVQNGTYIYDIASGSATYVLTPRWVLAASGSWDIWKYQAEAAASNNDHQDISETLSALYMLDARTTVGANFQHSFDWYRHPGVGQGLNGHTDNAYLSIARRFNTRLSLAVNAGYTVRISEDGSQSTAPSGSGTIVYNYGPNNSVSLTLAHSLSEASAGVTRNFSAQENTTLYLVVNHQIMTKLRGVADLSYTYSSFTTPLQGVVVTVVSPNDQSVVGHVGLNYGFRDWLSAVLDYSHTVLTSSDSRLIGPYYRNQISMGLTLSY